MNIYSHSVSPIRLKPWFLALLIIGIVTTAPPGLLASGYSGQWNVSPCTNVTCVFPSSQRVDLTFCSLAISEQYPALTITLGSPPVNLTGIFLTPTSFHVQGSVSSDCVVTYMLDGQFTDSVTFTAYLDKSVSGGPSCVFTLCYPDQGANITGTRASCCSGFTGNVDCDPANGTDISDLSTLIDNLYISFSPLCCEAAANTDGQPGIDISDLSALIDYLYINFTPTAPCQ